MMVRLSQWSNAHSSMVVTLSGMARVVSAVQAAKPLVRMAARVLGRLMLVSAEHRRRLRPQ